MTTPVYEVLRQMGTCVYLVCCSVLQCVAACCSVLQCVAEESVMRGAVVCVTVGCSVLQDTRTLCSWL